MTQWTCFGYTDSGWWHEVGRGRLMAKKKSQQYHKADEIRGTPLLHGHWCYQVQRFFPKFTVFFSYLLWTQSG